MMILKKATRGLTLLEVLVAMVLLAFGLLGLAPLMVTTMTANDRGREMTEATVHCTDRLEALKNAATPGLLILVGSPLVDTVYAQGAGGVRTYVMQTVVDTSTASNGVPSGMIRITVTTEWSDERGVDHDVSVSTYRGRAS
jgi:type IV pilus assembly protein PilV